MARAKANRRKGSGIRMTIRNVPDWLDKTFRNQAAVERRSLNSVVVEALGKGIAIWEERDRAQRTR
jgi:hypothetical protein